MEGIYIEPSYNNYSCAGESVNGVPVPPQTVVWAGIGGVNANFALGQDGTAHNVGGIANHGTWYEVAPYINVSTFPQNEFTTNIGDAIVPYVVYSGGVYYFEVYDATTKQVSTTSASGYPYTGESAEVIAERPTVRINNVNYLTALGNFTSPIAMASEANGTTFDQYPATGARYGVHMSEYSTGQDLADPGNISGPTGDFYDTYMNCGGVERSPGQ